MSVELLLREFERIADASDVIAQLRRFVMNLAVCGKLVEQTPADGTGAEFLSKIRSVCVSSGGRVSREARLRSAGEIAEPHELPRTWVWARFGDLARFSAGRTPSRNDLSFWNSGGFPWVSIADMLDRGQVTTTKETVSPKAKDYVFKADPKPAGTIVMSYKLTIGKISRLAVAAYHNEAIISITPWVQEMDPYLFLVLPERARRGATKGAIKGATLNRDSLDALQVPLPPLAEQQRIVAKVDELMALCDQLEAAQKEREIRRDWLRSESLQRLTSAGVDGAAAEVRFFLRESPRMITKPEHVTAVRQTILDLAVRGRLVPQDPADKPADSLLSGIAMRRTRSVVRLQPKLSTQPTREPGRLPSSWEWATLSEVCVSITDGDHQAPPKSGAGIPFLVISNVRSGRVDYQSSRHVSESYFARLDEFHRPRKGDVLYTLVGSYGLAAPVERDEPFCVQRHIGILRPEAEMVQKYLLLALSSTFSFDQATNCATGIAQKTVPLGGLRSLLVPVPPYGEQQRIVAEVDKLMALCDELEVALVSSTEARGRLLEALLHEALQGAG